MKNNFWGATIAIAALAFAVPVSGAHAQALKISRASIAKIASFKVVSTLAPKGGLKTTQTYAVQVKGSKARLDYSDPNLGDVSYIAGDKGVFLYLPGNQTATKQGIAGGVEGALRYAFGEANNQLKTAKKIGVATVSGQKTDVYKDAKTGTTIYVSRTPGFRLPVKTVLSNVGGTRTLLVTAIKLNGSIPDARFTVPAGTQIITSQGGAMSAPTLQ